MPAKTKRKKTASAKSKYDAKRANAFSIIIFALGILIAAFSIPFETSSGFLLAIRHFLSGMFGLAVFFVGPLLIYFAVMISANKRSSLAEKTVVSLLFLLIFCGIIQVAAGLPEGDGFFKKFASLYSLGTAYKGGGVLSAAFGWSLLALFKSKILSMFVLILAAFVLFMIVSGFTLIQFFKFVSKPFVWIYKKVKSAFENLGKDADEEKERRQRSVREKKFDEIASNISSQPEGNAQAVPDNPIVNAVIGKKKQDKAPDEPQAKAPDSNQESIEDIIKNVISDSPAEEKPEQQESINLKEEEAKITEEVENEEKPRAVYQIPPVSLLNPPAVSAQGTDIQRELKSNAENLVNTLKSFGVETRVININRGPAVTRYELQPSAGVKISKITNLADDIALNLAAAGVRIEAPIPNK
ncbi:MAG: DNA translocase FtsK, partial [Oscillospiraceae bacterium]